MRAAWFLASLLLASVALAQQTAQMTWAPPDWNFPQDVKATVSGELVTKLRIGTVHALLEKTKMDDLEVRLGGTIGSKGDAGDSVEWLCFHGVDEFGGWVLWLESGEIDGGYLGSFQWQHVPHNATLDSRCHALSGTIALPLSLRLGMSEAEILKALGQPSFRQDERLIYLHEHQETIKGLPYDSSNIVMIGVHQGKVTSIAVSKTTSS